MEASFQEQPTDARQRCETLLIVSHVHHYGWAGRIHAYGPYAREIDMWCDIFPHIVIAAPYSEEPPPGDCVPLTRGHIEVLPQIETGGTNLRAKLAQVLLLPRLVWQLSWAMRQADAIHVRCPGNLGLLGAVLAPLFSPYRVAKYAGQWTGYPGEPATVRLQRAILRSRWWGAPVTVYGDWPGQPPHIVPFFTSVLTSEHVARARRVAEERAVKPVPHVLYVGRLSKAKNVDVLLSALGRLKSQGIVLPCSIVGDGPQRQELERQARAAGLDEAVTFVGSVQFEEVLGYYEEADVLVLASETEGWPKAIAEGMAFGLVCVGSDRGLVPWMLGEGRGLIVQPRDVDGLAEVLRQIARQPEQYLPMRRQAAAWAQRHSLESLRDSLVEMLSERWNCRLERRTDPVTVQA